MLPTRVGRLEDHQPLRGRGIVDTNELNSYLDYCSHQRGPRIWREKKKKGIRLLKRGFHLRCVTILRRHLFNLSRQAALEEVLNRQL